MINRALKMGERVKVVNTTSGHNFAVGTFGKVSQVFHPGQFHPTATYQLTDDKGIKNNAYHQDLEFAPASRADIGKEADALRSQIAALDAQLAYLDETKSETFDDLEWRCYQA